MCDFNFVEGKIYLSLHGKNKAKQNKTGVLDSQAIHKDAGLLVLTEPMGWPAVELGLLCRLKTSGRDKGQDRNCSPFCPAGLGEACSLL